MDREFGPVGRLTGAVRPPADKSIAHRALMLAAMAGGRSRLVGRVAGNDVGSTRSCMQALGASVSQAGADELLVKGAGWEVPTAARLDCGNSGTTMRLLAGALAGRRGRFELSGDRSLSSRPMERVAGPLRQMGARITTADGCPPLTVRGGGLSPIEYRTPVASAQVKSAILLAGLQADGRTTVWEPAPSRDHTERMLAWLGCAVELIDGGVAISGGTELFRHDGFEMTLPGDLSSGAFWLVAAVLCPGSEVELRGVGLNPGRMGILHILERMGAHIDKDVSSSGPEPAGTVRARHSDLAPVEIAGALVPQALDELPLAVLAATQASGTTVLRDAAELRVKETDRIGVLVGGLRILGARITEEPDGLIVEGPTRLSGGVVDAAGDHRMAMTFAVAGLIAGAPVTVRGFESAAVSYPGFTDDLERLTK